MGDEAKSGPPKHKFIVLQIVQTGRNSPIKDWCGTKVLENLSLIDLFHKFNIDDDQQQFFFLVSVGKSKTQMTEVMCSRESPVLVQDVVETLGNFIQFTVPAKEMELNKPQSKNAFTMMMDERGAVSVPQRLMTRRYPGLSKLKNAIMDWIEKEGLGWSQENQASAWTFINTLAEALWHIDKNHDSLNQRGCKIPEMFSTFVNFKKDVEAKKRKIDESFLSENALRQHTSALYNLMSMPFLKKECWRHISDAIGTLSEALLKYADYMKSQTKRVKDNQSMMVVKESETINIMEKTETEIEEYKYIVQELMERECWDCLFLNDYSPVDRKKRYRFFSDLKLPMRCLLISESSGSQTLYFACKIDEIMSSDDVINRAHDVCKHVRATVPKYHSRSMKREFVQSFGLVANKAVLRSAYRSLTGDCSSSETLDEAEVDRRLEQVLDEQDPELLWDRRHCNPGRPLEYDTFLNKCRETINAGIETAVDDRRHDQVSENEVITHLATAVSVRDLYDQVIERCDEGTKIPSLQWLRLQFWPRRPTAKAAARFTGKLKIKFMVQARQFRAHHVDSHYASALFRYQKKFSIRFKEHLVFVSMDDKHTIKVGEPGCPVAAVERGKQVLVAMGKKFVVADHDFTRLSLTPSVNLFIDVPDHIDDSFHVGQVCISFKENCFQPSSPIRHMTELRQEMTNLNLNKPMLLAYTDGGPDHRVTYLSVQLSLIAMFVNLDLDFLCAVRTPPKRSWKNPVERIMSIINVGLQGVGVMREKAITHEDKLTKCGGLKDTREMAKTIPELKEEVLESVQPCIELLRNVMERLKLKDQGFKTFGPADIDEMADLWSNVLQVDDSLTPEVKTQQHLKNQEQLKQFIDNHCQIRNYMFSILKCTSPECGVCKPPRLPIKVFSEVHHLPDPMPDGDKYYSFEELYGKKTTEHYRPSFTVTRATGHGCPFNPSAQTAKNAGVIIQCEECEKWRCLYAKKKLTKKTRQALELLMETALYSCGATLTTIEMPDDDPLKKVYVRENLTCNTLIEFTFYSAGYEDVCIHCGTLDELQLVDEYYPQCSGCNEQRCKKVHRRGRKFK
ncbi:uncharacterized protein [Antedon mediterranea]|uniref:uncharacterized protein n=1 Tax=Antedon mediterranea TaxID=105859 RepID=UPI003AF8ACF2